jgi:hypothetical protein
LSRRLSDLDRESLAAFEIDDWHDFGTPVVEEFTEVVEQAGTREGPLQDFLERHRVLVASAFLRGGHGRWVMREKRFGDAFRADFLAAEDSSIGIEWYLIEIEPPVTKGIYQPKVGWYDRAARGIQQIREWRAYIDLHRESLWKPRTDWGGGLPRITRDAKGWVIVGREADFTPEHQWIRDNLKQSENIEVRSWDFVIRSLRGTAAFNERHLGKREAESERDSA